MEPWINSRVYVDGWGASRALTLAMSVIVFALSINLRWSILTFRRLPGGEGETGVVNEWPMWYHTKRVKRASE